MHIEWLTYSLVHKSTRLSLKALDNFLRNQFSFISRISIIDLLINVVQDLKIPEKVKFSESELLSLIVKIFILGLLSICCSSILPSLNLSLIVSIYHALYYCLLQDSCSFSLKPLLE